MKNLLTLLTGMILLIQQGCNTMNSTGSVTVTDLFAQLPETVVTPDGMAIAPDGDLVIACPNYADQSKKACLLKIDSTGFVKLFFEVPPLTITGVACPMGIDFAPNGDLFICDNQGWSGKPEGQMQGRILCVQIKDNQNASITIVAEGMEHPNGVHIHGDYIYVTQSLMAKVKDPSGFLVSAVYRFRQTDINVKVTNTLEDKNILTTFLTKNKFCQYGADGLVFDSKGNLYVGNFGDGTLNKITFDSAGNVKSNTVFAKTDFDYKTDPKSKDFITKAVKAKMRTTDGICVDDKDNIYVADFSNNAIAKVTPDGKITVIAQNGDSNGQNGELNEPGEPIFWKGKLIVSNFDCVFGPDKINTKHDMPATLSSIKLK